MATSALASRSTLRLSEVTQRLVIPSGIVESEWPRIEHRLADMAIRYDTWQKNLAEVALGLRGDGKYAATVGGVGLSIPRQVGKTFTVGSLLIAMAVEFPGLVVLWTAHHSRTTTKTFRTLQGMVTRKRVAPHLAHNGIRTANGEQEIRFANGSIIMFGAREHGFGRGFDAVDVLVFDEAQILSDKALEDMVAATNQSRHEHGALIFYMGTPPRPADDGEAFTSKRRKALKSQDGDVRDTMWVECAADPGSDPDDREQWAKANPSYPHHTSEEAMLRMRENLPSLESWFLEAFGEWPGEDVVDVFGAGRWKACAVAELPDVQPASIGLAVSLDRTSASIASAALFEPGDDEDEDDDVDEDDLPVFVAGVDRRPEVDWLVAEAKRIQDTYDCTVLADDKGGVADMREAFEDADVDVTWVNLGGYVEACSDVFDRVRKGPSRLLHPGSGTDGVSELDAAVKGAEWRPVGDGRRVWGRKKSAAQGSDVAMLEAATFAVRGAQQAGVGIW